MTILGLPTLRLRGIYTYALDSPVLDKRQSDSKGEHHPSRVEGKYAMEPTASPSVEQQQKKRKYHRETKSYHVE